MHTWTRNFLGLRITEQDMETITCPNLELGVHVTFKTVQAGSVAGVGIVGPLLAACTPGCNASRIITFAGKSGRIGALLGLVIGPIMTYIRVRQETSDGVSELCYKLRQHKSQLKVDRCSVVGLLTGYTAASFVGFPAQSLGVIGLTAGVMIAEAFDLHTKDEQKPTEEVV